MTDVLDLTGAQRALLDDLLRRHLPGVEVWAYGSRVKGTARRYSDLDLVAFASDENVQAVRELREVLDESDLPFLVDLHVWDELPERFHGQIRERHVVLRQGLERGGPPSYSSEKLPPTIF